MILKEFGAAKDSKDDLSVGVRKYRHSKLLSMHMSQKSILPDRLKVLIRPDLAQIELSLLRQNLFTAFLA